MLRRELSATIRPICSALDRLLGHAVARVETADVADLQDPVGPCRRVDDRLTVRDRRRHRLLQEDVLACSERRERGRGVLVPHRHDRDRVDLGVGEQVVIVAVGLGDAELRRHRVEALRRARAQRGELEVRDADDRLAVDLAEPAEADHADAQPLHHTPPSRWIDAGASGERSRQSRYASCHGRSRSNAALAASTSASA